MKRSFLKDRRGLAWIWIVGLGLTIPFCAVIYWVMDYAFDKVAAVSTSVYTFTGTMAYSWNAAELLISYLLAFSIIFAVVWVIQNSRAPNLYGG